MCVVSTVTIGPCLYVRTLRNQLAREVYADWCQSESFTEAPCSITNTNASAVYRPFKQDSVDRVPGTLRGNCKRVVESSAFFRSVEKLRQVCLIRSSSAVVTWQLEPSCRPTEVLHIDRGTAKGLSCATCRNQGPASKKRFSTTVPLNSAEGSSIAWSPLVLGWPVAV
jgi:hypothetical protein